MQNQNHRQMPRRLAIAACASTLIGLGAAAPAIQAADTGPNAAAGAPLILADTQGSERRDDRRDDRDECRDEGGAAGKDKRDCKQEGRQENEGNDKEGGDDKAEGSDEKTEG
jgi:hypothetical protein